MTVLRDALVSLLSLEDGIEVRRNPYRRPAGFDLVNSSEEIFAPATTVLHAVIAARLTGQDADTAARAVIETW